MFLTADGNVFEYLPVEHLHLLIAYHQAKEGIVGNGIECRLFKSLDDETAGFLFEKALDAKDDSPFEGEVLCDVLLVLVVVLSNHAFLDVIEGVADVSFLQDGVAFLELHWDENTSQHIYSKWRHGAIDTGYFLCYVAKIVHVLCCLRVVSFRVVSQV